MSKFWLGFRADIDFVWRTSILPAAEIASSTSQQRHIAQQQLQDVTKRILTDV
jgi:hypothetical protein